MQDGLLCKKIHSSVVSLFSQKDTILRAKSLDLYYDSSIGSYLGICRKVK